MVRWLTMVTDPKTRENIPEHACISQSTHDGLVALLAARPIRSKCQQVGRTLVDYLSTLQKPINLTTTGHSKGGALSPTLALWLKDNQSSWDKTLQSTISSMPTAGPTAGNQEFAAYSDKTLTTITRFANSLDIVPHAWDPGMLEQIPTLYQRCGILPDAGVVTGVASAVSAANAGKESGKDGDYTQLQSDPWWRIEGKCTSGPNTFELEAIFQHTIAYDNYFKIPINSDNYVKIKPDPICG